MRGGGDERKEKSRTQDAQDAKVQQRPGKKISEVTIVTPSENRKRCVRLVQQIESLNQGTQVDMAAWLNAGAAVRFVVAKRVRCSQVETP
jgi:hypothetical protein